MAPKVEVTLSSTTGDDWNKLAKTYTSKLESPSTKAVEGLLENVDRRLPFSKASSILDNGCGPGVVVSALISIYGNQISDSCELLCSDFSSAMVQEVDRTKTAKIEEGKQIWTRVKTMVANAMDMEAVPSESQSHILAGWVYFMTPDPRRCLSESKRMLKSGGVLGVTSWAGSQWLDLMNEFTTVNPDRVMPSLPEEWKSTQAVQTELETAGFSDVQSVPVTVHMGYESHDALIKFLLYSMPHMVALCKGLSDEQLQRTEKALLTKIKEISPEQPGRLKGDAIIAIGSKL